MVAMAVPIHYHGHCYCYYYCFHFWYFQKHEIIPSMMYYSSVQSIVHPMLVVLVPINEFDVWLVLLVEDERWHVVLVCLAFAVVVVFDVALTFVVAAAAAVY